MGPTVTEIAPDVFRINIAPDDQLTFSCFPIRDDQPAMVETGFNTQFGMFELVKEAVAQLIDPASLRYLIVPHVEGDECGSLNSFLQLAPAAQPVCSPIGAMVTIGDYTSRSPKVVKTGDKLVLGNKTLQAVITPWVHVWDSMVVYDETDQLLFTSDLFAQPGNREPITDEDRSEDVVTLARFSGAFPSQVHLERALERIETLKVDVLACHHGSVLAGDPTRYYRALRNMPVGDVLDAPFYEMVPGT